MGSVVERCDIGVMHCIMSEPTIQAELLSFAAVMLLPLALAIRIAIDELIFMRKFNRQKEAMDKLNQRVKNIESWIKKLYKESL